MPKSDKLVEPRVLKGFQDLLPEEAIVRRNVIHTIEQVFQTYGFVPVETPALEHLDTLMGTGGEETNKELFRLESPEGDPIAMRFDLTVPFSRLMAQYPDKLKTPFRRYAVGPVWRVEKPSPGRFRQFTQFDIDAAGAKSVAVDAEVVSIMCEAMAALGVPRYRVLINNRKLIDAVLEGCGIKDIEKQKHVLRVVDKLAKVGMDNVRRELGEGRVDDSGDPIPGVHLDDDTIDHILTFIGAKADTRLATVDAMADLLPESRLSTDAVNEMRELAEALDALGVAEENAVFDPSLARGLDYYTGPVFEMQLPDALEFGSVGGGGRYDGLVERFVNRPIACTGMSIGLDRLLAALDHLGVIEKAKTSTQVLVVSIGRVPTAESLRCASELRAEGINTEVFFAARKKMNMGNQLSHADHYGIPVAVILGEDELAQGVVAVKDLVEGKAQREDIDDRDAYREAGKTGQVTVKREDMIATVKGLLS